MSENFKKAIERIASKHTSTDAYEKLMDWFDANPAQWTALRKDQVMFRAICTRMILDEQHKYKSTLRNLSNGDIAATLKPVSIGLKAKDAQFLDSSSKSFTPADNAKQQARQDEKDAERRNSMFNMVVFGIRLGDANKAQVYTIMQRYRGEQSAAMRMVAFFDAVHQGLPNGKIKVREHYNEKAMHSMYTKAQKAA